MVCREKLHRQLLISTLVLYHVMWLPSRIHHKNVKKKRKQLPSRLTDLISSKLQNKIWEWPENETKVGIQEVQDDIAPSKKECVCVCCVCVCVTVCVCVCVCDCVCVHVHVWLVHVVWVLCACECVCILLRQEGTAKWGTKLVIKVEYDHTERTVHVQLTCHLERLWGTQTRGVTLFNFSCFL